MMNAVLGLMILAMLPAEPGVKPKWEPPVGREMVVGYASAYAPEVMEEVVRFRMENGFWRNTPPPRWVHADGYIATNDCAQVGLMATLVGPTGDEYEVLIADCAGHDSTLWMTENRIVAELDWGLWELLTAAHGRPLEVGLR